MAAVFPSFIFSFLFNHETMAAVNTTSKVMNLKEVGRELKRSVESDDESVVYTCFLPNLDGGFRAAFRGYDLEICLESGDPAVDESEGSHLAFVGAGSNPLDVRSQESFPSFISSSLFNLETMAAALVYGALLFGFIIVIRKLTRVLYKAFLMDRIHTEASQREREDQSATTTSTMMNLEEVGRGFERSVIDEGNQIRERIKLLVERASHLRLNVGVPTRSLQRVPAPLVGNESDVVGRDGDKKKIIEMLLSADTSRNNLSVIPIVGMGGIGKTTLAQLVYKDSRVQQHFDLKVWVTISEEFNVFQITKDIYEEVTSQECRTRQLLVLQSKLNEALAGKRFLFVLDDVWNENYQRWESLESGFQSGAAKGFQ